MHLRLQACRPGRGGHRRLRAALALPLRLGRQLLLLRQGRLQRGLLICQLLLPEGVPRCQHVLLVLLLPQVSRLLRRRCRLLHGSQLHRGGLPGSLLRRQLLLQLRHSGVQPVAAACRVVLQLLQLLQVLPRQLMLPPLIVKLRRRQPRSRQLLCQLFQGRLLRLAHRRQLRSLPLCRRQAGAGRRMLLPLLLQLLHQRCRRLALALHLSPRRIQLLRCLRCGQLMSAPQLGKLLCRRSSLLPCRRRGSGCCCRFLASCGCGCSCRSGGGCVCCCLCRLVRVLHSGQLLDWLLGCSWAGTRPRCAASRRRRCHGGGRRGRLKCRLLVLLLLVLPFPMLHVLEGRRLGQPAGVLVLGLVVGVGWLVGVEQRALAILMLLHVWRHLLMLMGQQGGQAGILLVWRPQWGGGCRGEWSWGWWRWRRRRRGGCRCRRRCRSGCHIRQAAGRGAGAVWRASNGAACCADRAAGARHPGLVRLQPGLERRQP